MKAKVLTGYEITVLNRKAIQAKRNRTLTTAAIEALDWEGVNIVSWSMLHNDVEIRCHIMAKFYADDEPHSLWLDMSIKDFNKLREVELPDPVEEHLA